MFLYVCGFPDFLPGAAFDTIARKPEHDKATWPARDIAALNCAIRIAIV
jgi:hypothetical protein